MQTSQSEHIEFYFYWKNFHRKRINRKWDRERRSCYIFFQQKFLNSFSFSILLSHQMSWHSIYRIKSYRFASSTTNERREKIEHVFNLGKASLMQKIDKIAFIERTAKKVTFIFYRTVFSSMIQVIAIKRLQFSNEKKKSLKLLQTKSHNEKLI